MPGKVLKKHFNKDNNNDDDDDECIYTNKKVILSGFKKSNMTDFI